jgi:hypothetical protein
MLVLSEKDFPSKTPTVLSPHIYPRSVKGEKSEDYSNIPDLTNRGERSVVE